MIFKHFEGLDWQPKVNDKGSPNVLGVTAYIHFSSAQYLEAYSRCWHYFKLYTAANLANGCFLEPALSVSQLEQQSSKET